MYIQRFMKKVSLFLVIGFVLFSTSITQASASTTIQEQFKASGGVDYKDTRFPLGNYNQAVRIMEINVADPYTRVEVGVPSPLNRLARTTTQALAMHTPTNRVVGAINGSFNNEDRLPMYLIAKDNKLVNAGIIASGKDQYVNTPLAFGMKSDGKGSIDSYDLDFTFIHKGNTYPITSTNKQRSADSLIVYTPDFPGGYTNTNVNGMEVVVSLLPGKPTLEFGKPETGIVESIRPYNDNSNTKIPANGFVLSAHGASMAVLKDIEVGDEITLSANIDDSWQQASFLLAGGPMLVQDGKVSLSMDPNSSRARERAPRTAVAVDKTGTKVYFITVDGRQAGYSDGMNLTEFAQHLASLGVDRALNLDGGGSTTMAIRNNGNETVTLANRPSDGTERGVSTVLVATSTAPVGQPTYLKASLPSATLVKDSSVPVKVDYILDQFYNPLKLPDKDITYSSTLGTFSGSTFTAKKLGKGSITVKVGNLVETIPFEVVEKKDKETIENFDSITNWSVTSARGSASIGLSGAKDPLFEGNHALKLTYDFTSGGAGTAAAYVNAKNPITISGDPKYLGMRVFGDAGKQWLRGKVVDANGTAHTINFTEEKGLTWNGWYYVKANLPSTLVKPLKLEQIYIAQPHEELKGKGMIYLDELDVVYEASYKASLFKDTGVKFIAETEVDYLVRNAVISGFTDGKFQPQTPLNRVQAAILLTRALGLDTASVSNPGFKDVPETYTFYKEIAAAANAGYVKGKENGTAYDPYGLLTRAEMAAVLQRAFKLPITNKQYFTDNKGGFAVDAINALAESQTTIGYNDNTFRGANSLSRTEFSMFLYRALTR